MSNVTIQDITNKFNELEEEIKKLKSEKALLEGVFAAVMKKVKKIEDCNLKDIYLSDYKKLHFYKKDEFKITVEYIDGE